VESPEDVVKVGDEIEVKSARGRGRSEDRPEPAEVVRRGRTGEAAAGCRSTAPSPRRNCAAGTAPTSVDLIRHAGKPVV